MFCWPNLMVWEKNEFDDMFEITKILSMFMKSSHIITEREKFLQNKVDNDAYGVFTLSKFEEEVGRKYHDYNLLMLVVLITGVLVIASSLIAQSINEVIDPRMKVTGVSIWKRKRKLQS